MAAGALTGPVAALLRDSIKGYCLSHAHLDHVAGLLLNAPDDAPKPIYGLPACLDILQSDYLNWRAWPNFGNGGAAPALGQYTLRALVPGQSTPLAGTPLSVRAYPLSHGRPYQAPLFWCAMAISICCIWATPGPTAWSRRTACATCGGPWPRCCGRGSCGPFLSKPPTPMPSRRPGFSATSRPALLLHELGALGQLAGPAALRGLPVVITHLKPTAANEALIRQQLAAGNALGVRLVFPVQGERLAF